MKKDMLTIIKKEFARFFGDKRMVFTTILMPGLMIYILYTFMGKGLMGQFTTDDAYIASAYVQNPPQELSAVLQGLPVNWTELSEGEAERAREAVEAKDADLLLVFPADFSSAVAEYQVSDGPAPNVEIYYNSTAVESANLYSVIRGLLDSYEEAMANKFDVNAGGAAYDLASQRDATGQLFSMLLPMLMVTFLFSGCVSIAPEAIAGEKERGTIATLLVTPMKRSSLALGKIISLSAIALLAGLSSFLGTMLSLPNLMAGSGAELDASVYGVTDYLLLLGIIFSTVLVLVSLISVISAFAKSIKEASAANSPLMILSMGVSLTTMFGSSEQKSLGLFCIPIYNSVHCMYGIFSFQYSAAQMAVTMASNLVYAILLAGVLTRLFNSEKVMFSK
ncbi:MAG: ABC transporter permease subunit [Roseburia sp.]|nr:ABC transporter permease subunit [Roseburia sp.]MCM1098183.1 ABC transporter permease subunit [Ruminococcus flavefaciens]